MMRRCSGGPETMTLFNWESPMSRVLPIRSDSGPPSSWGEPSELLPKLLPPPKLLLPPKLLRPVVLLRLLAVRPERLLLLRVVPPERVAPWALAPSW